MMMNDVDDKHEADMAKMMTIMMIMNITDDEDGDR